MSHAQRIDDLPATSSVHQFAREGERTLVDREPVRCSEPWRPAYRRAATLNRASHHPCRRLDWWVPSVPAALGLPAPSGRSTGRDGRRCTTRDREIPVTEGASGRRSVGTRRHADKPAPHRSAGPTWPRDKDVDAWATVSTPASTASCSRSSPRSATSSRRWQPCGVDDSADRRLAGVDGSRSGSPASPLKAMAHSSPACTRHAPPDLVDDPGLRGHRRRPGRQQRPLTQQVQAASAAADVGHDAEIWPILGGVEEGVRA